ncbi:uncharacterized protein TrAFT101_007643 [Trichoderma asperellum]|uniref:uncharacterized protein n=1 Tax=Trichoderma asperellum TaxID=101201 RepID=UPI0033337821|nr:hypothetical protein TrAFT101_007643 [Trichoderma asperellum]
MAPWHSVWIALLPHTFAVERYAKQSVCVPLGTPSQATSHPAHQMIKTPQGQAIDLCSNRGPGLTVEC